MKHSHKALAVSSLLALSLAVIPAAHAQSAAPAPAAKKSGHHAKAAAAQAGAAAPAGANGAKPAEAGKRDPFLPLVNEKQASGPPLPPGKAGLVVATVRIDGTVRSPEGMMAVV